MPAWVTQQGLKKTIIFKWMAKLYDAYNLWRYCKKMCDQMRAIPDDCRHFFIFPFYHTGGAEKVHRDIVLANRSHLQAVFFTGNSYNNQYKNDIFDHALCFDLFKLLRTKRYKEKILTAVINKINYRGKNFVFSANAIEFYSHIVPAVYKKNKCIDLIHAFTHEHEPGAEKWSLPVAEKLYKRVVICKAVRNMLLEQYEKNNIPISFHNRIEVIYNFVDVGATVDIESRSELPFTVLYIGRNSPEKRVEDIVEVAKMLTKNKDLNFLFIGPGIEAFAETIFNKNIRFIGNLSAHELNNYYRSSHVIMLMSGREGLPVVLQEAMAFGVVPVSTDVGGIPEIIEQGKTGFLIEPHLERQDRINEAAVRIQALFQDRVLWAELSKNAIRFVRENFSKDRFEEGFRSVLR